MDQTAMLIAAIAALWGVLAVFARELRALWLRMLDGKDQQIAAKDREIAELKTEARATMAAKDEELREWRKRAYTAAERRPPTGAGEARP